MKTPIEMSDFFWPDMIYLYKLIVQVSVVFRKTVGGSD